MMKPHAKVCVFQKFLLKIMLQFTDHAISESSIFSRRFFLEFCRSVAEQRALFASRISAVAQALDGKPQGHVPGDSRGRLALGRVAHASLYVAAVRKSSEVVVRAERLGGMVNLAAVPSPAVRPTGWGT